MIRELLKQDVGVTSGGLIVQETMNLQNASTLEFTASIIIGTPGIPTIRESVVWHSRILYHLCDVVCLNDSLGDECDDSLRCRNIVLGEDYSGKFGENSMRCGQHKRFSGGIGRVKVR